MITNRQEAINKIEANYIKKHKQFRVGDTIKVHFKIKEGKRERIQVFQGIVIAMSGSGLGKTFMVRKISFGIGVERIFPFNSPKIDKIEVVKEGKVRRAKLYYLRDRVGKAHQTKAKVVKK
jgi:large subunit ribosomal protein L19